jgi:hypothetical protein
MRRRLIGIISALMISAHLLAQGYIETINIENQAVSDYMLDAAQTYSSNPDYRVSVVTKYNNSDKYGKKLYWPRGKEVVWIPTTVADNIQEIRITVSENEDYSDSLTYHPDEKSANRFVIRNSLPHRTYYYKVEEIQTNGVNTELANGVFNTIGQVRMIQVRNNSNIRDLGGWPTQYGNPVKYGRLYRSGSLERTTPEGRHDFVDNLGVVAELDLRHEVKRTKSCLGADKDYLRLNHGMYMEGLTKRYDVYVTDLQWIIARLREGKNVDWHCAIGCDRCGTLSFLIEGLLGMNEIDICRDYELSTFSLSSKNKRVRSPLKNMFNHIRKFGPPDNLGRCFYNYWLSIGMEREDLDYFLSEILGIPDISSMTREPEPYTPNEPYIY